MTTNEAEQKKEEEPKKEQQGSSDFTKKVIRIVTVMAYCSGISGAGVLLSLYYIFFWDPQITGVRPPGYLKSGARIGMVGMPEARVAPLPDAFSGRQPIAHPHKMSKEFMEAFLANITKDEVGPQNDLMAGQPTPKVMSVVRVGSEGADPHYTPTQPLSQRGEETSNHQGHSSTSPQQHQQERHQQQHHQQRHHQQGEALPTSA